MPTAMDDEIFDEITGFACRCLSTAVTAASLIAALFFNPQHWLLVAILSPITALLWKEKIDKSRMEKEDER